MGKARALLPEDRAAIKAAIAAFQATYCEVEDKWRRGKISRDEGKDLVRAAVRAYLEEVTRITARILIHNTIGELLARLARERREGMAIVFGRHG